MACANHTTAEPSAVVVPFPRPPHRNASALADQPWSRDELPANVVSIRPLPRSVRLPDTPERAFIRALAASLPPALYTRTVTRLQRESEEGSLPSKAAWLMALGEA